MFNNQIRGITERHFEAQSQTAYLASLKDSLPAGGVIIHGDFSENYSFVAQDASRDFTGTHLSAPFILLSPTDTPKVSSITKASVA
jgi:hypothetical protein